MSRWFAALRSALYATVFLGVGSWLALQARGFDRTMGVGMPTWTPLVGVLIMTLGAAVVLACVMSFVVSGRGTPAPFDPPREFVSTGPYRWVRNPMYLGGLTLLIGFAFLHRSLAMLILAGGFLGIFHAFVGLYEEPHLTRTFGDAYTRYRAEVRRWIPRRPRPQ